MIADITVAASEGMVIHLFLNLMPPTIPAIPMIIKIEKMLIFMIAPFYIYFKTVNVSYTHQVLKVKTETVVKNTTCVIKEGSFTEHDWGGMPVSRIWLLLSV